MGGATPALADFFLFEAFDALEHLLGPQHAERLQRTLPRLTQLRRDLLQRPRVAACQAARPSAFTSRPNERQILEALHARPAVEVWPEVG